MIRRVTEPVGTRRSASSLAYDAVRRMNERSVVAARIEDEGAIAVLRLADAARVAPVVAALRRGGVRIIELTMTVPDALAVLRVLARSMPPDVVLGAGTVLDLPTAREVIAAGARFVVSPVFRPRLIDECHRHDVVMIPGCYTPTEILDATEAGAALVKVVPATSLAPSFIRDLRAPLPNLKLVPTGGVTLRNAAEWLRAGAAAVGLGSGLVDPRAVVDGDFDAIADRAAQLMAAVRDARGPAPTAHDAALAEEPRSR
jgi:2-dehydro-3-deoxyphosphogluconate aldolase / (4S)-4-hydroxy-2-oxoglutarate aldolase